VDYMLIIERYGEPAVLSYFQDQNCQIFVTNSQSSKHNRSRQLTIYFNETEVASKFIAELREKAQIIEEIKTGNDRYFIFLQPSEMSRKMLEPVFQKILAE